MTDRVVRLMALLAYRVLRTLEPWLFPAPSHVKQAPRVGFPMTVYAHRGGPLEYRSLIENTMPAMKNAAALGVDLLELDVQLTADKQVVVYHDRALGRLAGAADKRFQGRPIAEFAYSELPALTGQSSQPNAAQQTAQEGSLGQGVETAPEPMPLLSSIFSAFPDMPIQVDVKVLQPGLVQAVHQLVQQHPGRRDKLLWGSFIHNVQCELFTCEPRIPLFTSAWRAIFLRVAHAAGRLHQVHIYESATILPWRMPYPWSRKHVWYPFLDRSYVEALSARGVDVIYFGNDLNNVDAYQACVAAGAQGICTDRPSLLQSYLKSNGHDDAAQ